MKKIFYTIWAMASLSAVLLCSCERDGWSEEELYGAKQFRPVSEVSGEGSYGRAFLTWTLPDSTTSLNYTQVNWENAAGEKGHQVFAKYLDSVWVTGLSEAEYVFTVTSCGENGEKAVSPELKLSVADWQKEPAAAIEEFKPMVAENVVYLDWKHPKHPTYTGVQFRIYQGEQVVKEAFVPKDSLPEYVFEGLEYSSSYRLEFYSMNLVNTASEPQEFPFETGLVAPKVPEIIKGDRIDYAHSADIQWTPTSDMDSVLVKFVDMAGEKREYRFGAAEGQGYLSMLPGGTREIEVQARGTNGTWSLPKTQKIKTRLKEEMVYINDKKVAECLVEKLGAGNGPRDFAFEQLSGIKEVTMKYQIEKIDEVELLVNLEILQITASYPPGADIAPTPEAFLQLVDRLPKIKELRVNRGWPRSAEIEKAFKDHPKVKFTLN